MSKKTASKVTASPITAPNASERTKLDPVTHETFRAAVNNTSAKILKGATQLTTVRLMQIFETGMAAQHEAKAINNYLNLQNG